MDYIKLAKTTINLLDSMIVCGESHTTTSKEMMSNAQKGLNKLLNIKEDSEYLNVHPNTLRRWEDNGKIIPLNTEGGHRRYTKEQLDSYIGLFNSEEQVSINVVATYSRVSSHEQKVKGI